jgi:F-type H+-transporting ATPase subunit a
VLHLPEESLLTRLTHGGVTPTNLTSPALATISFVAIIAGVRAHGFPATGRTWCRTGASGAWVILIPSKSWGCSCPFALTMRLPASMTGGHVAVCRADDLHHGGVDAERVVGLGMGWSRLLAVGISSSRHRRSVQAFVFTLLTAVFVGMAIHAHH